MQHEVKSARSSIVVPHFYSTLIVSDKEFFFSPTFLCIMEVQNSVVFESLTDVVIDID